MINKDTKTGGMYDEIRIHEECSCDIQHIEAVYPCGFNHCCSPLVITIPQIKTAKGMAAMAIYLLIPDDGDIQRQQPLNAERLLRSLNVTGKLIGFQYAVYMIEQVAVQPEQLQLITKRLYPETGKRFGASDISVERAVRRLVQVCWRECDHRILEHIAGSPLSRPPTNTEFIDMLASYLRQHRESE